LPVESRRFKSGLSRELVRRPVLVRAASSRLLFVGVIIVGKQRELAFDAQ
jgi:hypothetical protein